MVGGIGGTAGIALDLAVIVAAAAGLWLGSGLLVEGAVGLADDLGLSEAVIGLTVVAVGTSAPELVVTVDAALTGQGNIAVANVVGSNVFNLGFVLGGLALYRGLPTSRALVRRDGPVLVAAALLVSWFLLDGQLVSWEGGALVALWLGYVGTLLLRQRDRSAGTPAGDAPLVDAADIDIAVEGVVPDIPGTIDEWEDVEEWPLWKMVGAVLVGLVLLLVGARLLVGSASGIARAAGIADWLIGLTVVAAGTSMPEFATAAAAAKRGSHGVSAGTLVGSDLSNLLLALGVAAVLEPLVIGVAVLPNFGPLVLTVVLVVGLAVTEERVSRLEGALLVAVAAVRWVLPVF